MEVGLVTLGAAILGAIIGAAASTTGSMAVQRSSRIREVRARQLRHDIPHIGGIVEPLVAQLGRGDGPVPLSHIESLLEAVEREALVAGREDSRRAAHLVRLAHQIWGLERQVWDPTVRSRQPKMDPTEAIHQQLRTLVCVKGALDNYELWLRSHLLKPWWRRRAPFVPWPEQDR